MLKRRTAENGANECLIKWRNFSVKEATWHREHKENVVKSFEEEKKIKEQSLQCEPSSTDFKMMENRVTSN